MVLPCHPLTLRSEENSSLPYFSFSQGLLVSEKMEWRHATEATCITLGNNFDAFDRWTGQGQGHRREGGTCSSSAEEEQRKEMKAWISSGGYTRTELVHIMDLTIRKVRICVWKIPFNLMHLLLSLNDKRFTENFMFDSLNLFSITENSSI